MNKIKNYIFVGILIFSTVSVAQNPFWEVISLPNQDVRQIEQDRDGNFYAWVGEYIYKSTDSGISWESIFELQQCSNIADVDLVIDTTNINYDKIYVFERYTYLTCASLLFYSTDSGVTWHPHSLPVSFLPKVEEVAFDATGVLYTASRQKIYFTTNNGMDWNLFLDGEPMGWTLSRIQIDLDGKFYTNHEQWGPYTGESERILSSSDSGVTWTEEILSYNGEFNEFKSIKTGELFAGDWGLNFKKNGAQSWYRSSFLYPLGSMVVNKFNYIYVARYRYNGNDVHLLYSPDYGMNWYLADLLNEVNKLILDDDGFLYGATQYGFYKSFESTYPIVDKVTFEFPEIAVNDSSSIPFKLFNPFNTPLTVDSIASTNNSFVLNISTPLVLNPGDSLFAVLYYIPNQIGNFADSVIIFSNLKTQPLFTFAYSPIPTFRTIPNNLTDYHFGEVNIDSTRLLIVKIYNTSINNLRIDTIYTLSSQFQNKSYTYPISIASDTVAIQISFTPDSNLTYIDTVYIFNNSNTNPYKIILRGIGTFTSDVSEINEINTFSLSQNYPNPFNPITVIKFSLAEVEFTSLKVYDVLGKEVTTLVNEQLSAGEYEVEFNAEALPSGIYFYKLQAGEFIETKKMILLK